MPIYAYRCAECAHTEDVLQKMSDAPLTECPQCKQATFKKQLTAASFQFKGSGYYVTDFRDAGAEPKNTQTHTPVKTESSQKEASSSEKIQSTPASTDAVSSTSPDTSVASGTKTIAATQAPSSATHIAAS